MTTQDYLRRLYRKNPNFLGHIEGLRALAGLAVILYHIAIFASLYVTPAQYIALLEHPFFKMALSMSISVDIFFVITGLIIGYSLIKELKDHGKIDFYGFFVRRCARVYPVYGLLLLITAPISYASFHYVWANILQINNLLSVYHRHLIWTWSIAVDFQFYVTFSLILWLVSKRYLRAKTCSILFFAVWLLPFLITALLITAQQYHHMSIYTYMMPNPESARFFNLGFDQFYLRSGAFLYGVSTAYLLVHHQTRLNEMIDRIPTLALNLLSTLLLAALCLLVANDPIWFVHKANPVWQTSVYWGLLIQRNISSAVACALLLIASHPKGIVMNLILKTLNLSLWRPLAQLTFCSYLIHPLVLMMGYSLFFVFHQTVSAPQYFHFGAWLIAASYLIAVPLYALIEQPAMDKIKEKLLSKNRQIYQPEAISKQNTLNTAALDPP